MQEDKWSNKRGEKLVQESRIKRLGKGITGTAVTVISGIEVIKMKEKK